MTNLVPVVVLLESHPKRLVFPSLIFKSAINESKVIWFKDYLKKIFNKNGLAYSQRPESVKIRYRELLNYSYFSSDWTIKWTIAIIQNVNLKECGVVRAHKSFQPTSIWVFLKLGRSKNNFGLIKQFYWTRVYLNIGRQWGLTPFFTHQCLSVAQSSTFIYIRRSFVADLLYCVGNLLVRKSLVSLFYSWLAD